MITTNARGLRIIAAEYQLTATEFARRVGVCQPYMSALLRGQGKASLQTQERIERAVKELEANPPQRAVRRRKRGA